MNARKTGIRPPTYVVLEEGQLYFPQGCMRSMKKHSHAVELVTNGCNFNVRFGVITQFPSMIDKMHVKMCRQRYFGRTNEPNDVRYIEEIIGKKMAEELPKLEVGEFVYSYPVRKGGTRKIKVPMFHTQSRPKLIAQTPRHSRVGRQRRNKRTKRGSTAPCRGKHSRSVLSFSCIGDRMLLRWFRCTRGNPLLRHGDSHMKEDEITVKNSRLRKFNPSARNPVWPTFNRYKEE